MPSKPCSKCGEVKDYELFSKQASTKSGRASQCKVCQSAYSKKRYADNSERIKAEVKAARDKLKAESPELLRERTRRYNATNKENRAKYAKENPGVMNAKTAKYLAGKKQRTPEWLSKEQLEQILLFYKEAARLTKVLNVPHEVDHIVPLQGRNVSGLHVPWNLQILTDIENQKKTNNHKP